jgi:hypothetical protein
MQCMFNLFQYLILGMARLSYFGTYGPDLVCHDRHTALTRGGPHRFYNAYQVHLRTE